METVSALIVAGGSGSRFGQKKQFITLGGIPVLLKTVLCFADNPAIDRLIVVVPAEDVAATTALISDITTEHTVVAGGPTRAASVLSGLKVALGSRIVLIHDGVRPFVGPDLIHRVIAGLAGCDAAIPGLAVTDTLKEASDNTVLRTVARRNLFQIQTPQAFITENILAAHKQASGLLPEPPTDDSMLIEEQGGRVRIVDGDPYNIKITLPEDMLFAEAIHALQDRNRI
ncbi:MAG: 2-C-methyl-D-erythritol 4-phosphate cytidylyltransferase [Syntrophaceae bacterium]